MAASSHMHTKTASFLDGVASWAASQADVIALALVGSHAKGTATAQSDIDLVLITNAAGKYIDAAEWTQLFGAISRVQAEDYGMLTSLRVFYENGLEVEFGITTSAWLVLPLDAGTKRVIDDGLIILHEKNCALTTVLRNRSD